MTQSVSDSPQQQSEIPFAKVQGQDFTQLPLDLYIPPDALEVFLDAFEGPLDLLLYLIRRQNLDILDIPIAEITRQYMTYIDLMQDMKFELAAEYLVMAAMLAEIKSRMLLPRPADSDDEEGDPRAELIRRLQEYERYKKAAEEVDELPRIGRDTFEVSAKGPELNDVRPYPEVSMEEILRAFSDVLKRSDMYASHQIQREALSVRERMTNILAILQPDTFTNFTSLFELKEGRAGVVVAFLAILELIKESLVELVQNELFGPIYVKARQDLHAS